MQVIQKGSIFVTDAFAQALSFTETKLTKAVCITLPVWSNNAGMFLSGTEVGQSGGLQDPNIILPEAFSRYWLNLERHVRDYYNTTGVIEKPAFADIAFWKLIKRLERTQDVAQTMITSKISNDTEAGSLNMLYKDLEGLACRQILINIPTTQPAYISESIADKPNGLAGVQALPTNYISTMLNSPELAMYDASNNYSIQSHECLKYRPVSPIAEQTFAFNAILIYFESQPDNLGNTVEDLGAIYFTDAYKQSGNNTWQIANTEKTENVALTYAINLISNGAEYIQYHAENSQLPTAMQLYEQMFQQNIAYQNIIASMQQQLASMQSQVNSMQTTMQGLSNFALSQRLDQIQQLVGQRFQGNVSSERLLEMFELVIANSDEKTIYANLTDLTQAMLSDNIEVKRKVGSYQAGTILEAGSSVNAILAELLSLTNEATTTEDITVTKNAGSYLIGQVIPEGTKITDILKQIM